MGTNLAIAILLTIIVKFGGWQALFLVFLPTTLIAATTGVWLFYVQHQFETTHWEENHDWQVHEAALHGSSHYDLPQSCSGSLRTSVSTTYTTCIAASRSTD